MADGNGVSASTISRWTCEVVELLAARAPRLDRALAKIRNQDLAQCAASAKFLIRDRAGQFTESFDAVFTADGIRILLSPPQAPRANAICERMIGTLRHELFDRLLIITSITWSGS
jgi:transposase InsO family protein